MAQGSGSKGKAAPASKTGKATGSGAPFTPACTLPFADIAGKDLAIDKICGKTGSETNPTTPEALQNAAKNNLCATGNPVTVKPAGLIALQQATANSARHITFGGESEVPKNRSVLTNFTISGQSLSEGTVVRMAAFVIETHYADTTSGESVNCKQEGDAGNDVHMALGLAYGADECTSVTAEISPHFRTPQWLGIAGIEPKAKEKNTPALAQAPIRVTGQLFFDASHKPCANGKPISGDPARASLWEIHPVYKLEVCKNKTLASCSADDDSVWTPLNDPGQSAKK